MGPSHNTVKKDQAAYNILSQEERLRKGLQGKDVYIAQAKKELFADLFENNKQELSESLVERKNLVNDIKGSRNTNNDHIPRWEITLRANPNEKKCTIESLDSYSFYVGKYKELQDKTPPAQEAEFEKLDKQLAEELILDNRLSIEFKTENGISNRKESLSSYKRLNKNVKYQDKIERIQIGKRWEPVYIIKRTEEQLKRIEKTADELEQNNSAIPPVQPTPTVVPENNIDTAEVSSLKFLVNRDNLADELKTLRSQSIVELWKKEIRLRSDLVPVKLVDQKWFLEYLQQIWNTFDIEKLKKLDTEFAEKIILDNNLQIQIDNPQWQPQKLERDCIDQANTCVKSLQPFGYDLEYVTIPEGNTIHHIVRKKVKKIEPEPVIPPNPEPVIPQEDLHMSAVLSDMGTDVHRERVSLETEEELRDKYKNLGRYNIPQRAYLFLSRWAKRKRMIKEKMDALTGKAFSGIQSLDEKTGDASDRHELELQHKLDSVEKANRVSIQNVQVNDLCKEYLKWTISDTQFQTQFNTIVDADANIQTILQWQKITHIWTNILEKLKQQKARITLNTFVEKEFSTYLVDSDQTHINAINTQVTNYIKQYQVNPEFMGDYQDAINNIPWAKNKLEQYLKHQSAIMNMQISNVKMNIDILTKGKSAYQIDNKDRNKWLWYKIGHALDKLPRWVQTGWFIWLSVWTGILTGWLGAVAAAAITTWVSASAVWGMNALKKRTHYTKEQHTHEKNVVTDYRNEQARLQEWQNRALSGKRYNWKTYKAKRQLALYDQTTQENIQISNNISEVITDLSSKVEALNTRELNYLKKNLIQWKVRLDYYRERWHNFLASNEKEVIEKDMKRLEKSIILGTNKLWISLNDIKNQQATDDNGTNLTYASIRKDLESSYNKSLVQFKRERRVLAAKYGIGTALLSGWISLGMQYLLWTGVFSQKWTEWITGSTNTKSVSDTFDLGKHELLDTGTKNNIYNTWTNAFSESTAPSWSTVTFTYGSWTDAVNVIPGRLTPEVYSSKLSSVINHINQLWLDSNTKTALIDHINSRPWEASWSTSNFTNDALHGMRCLETIEQSAKALADSWRSGDLLLNIKYDQALDIVGSSKVANASERVANAVFSIKTPDIPWLSESTRGRFLQFPVFFNTFKDRLDQKKDGEHATKTADKKPNKTDKQPEKIKQPEYIPTPHPTTPDKDNYRKTKWEKNGNTPFDDDDTFRIDPNKPFTPWAKIWVNPRWTVLPSDTKPYFEKEYAKEFYFKTPEQIATLIITDPKYRDMPLYTDPKYWISAYTPKIQEAIIKWDKKTAIKLLTDAILTEKNRIAQKNEIYNQYIDESLTLVDKTFTELGGDRSLIPDKSKIHIVWWYEFWWQRGLYQSNLLGFCSYMDGELIINHDALTHSSSWKELSPEQIKAALQHVIIHEVIHGTSAINYRNQYREENWEKIGFDFPNARRVGLMMFRRQPNSLYPTERWRALNEAVTEHLNRTIIQKNLQQDIPNNSYRAEREVLDLLCKQYNIPHEQFTKAIVNRKQSLKTLTQSLEWQNSIRPRFFDLLLGVMDYEYSMIHGDSSTNTANDYVLTKKLISGDQLTITEDMKKFFHPGLLASNGQVKDDILKAYKHISDAPRQAVAA